MKNKVILIAVVIIFAGGVGYYIWSDLNNVELPMSNNCQQGSCSENSENINSPAPSVSAEPVLMPDLNRKINIAPDISEEVKSIALSKISEIAEILKETPEQADSWLALGVYYKMLGDYESARDVWEYVAKIRPDGFTPFGNLADLYAYYIKDNKKAEENFLKAIENGPTMINFYRSTYEFYRFVMKNDVKAKSILQKGIDSNPGTSQDLKYLLDNY